VAKSNGFGMVISLRIGQSNASKSLKVNIIERKNKIWIISSHKYSNILKLIAIIYPMPFGMNRKFNTLREMFRDYNKSN